MPVKLSILVKAWNPRGQLIYLHQGPAYSFVRGWMGHIKTALDNIGQTMPDVDNNNYLLMAPAATATNYMNINAGLGILTHGIRFGTGNTAPTITDYALQTPITEGVGAGQFQHLAMLVGTPTYADPIATLTISRTANNNSGAPIGVNEIGIYCESRRTGTILCYWCLARDVLAATATVPAAGAIQAIYTLQLTV